MCSCVTGGARVYSLCELMPYDVRGCVSVTTCGHGPVYCASSYVLCVRVLQVPVCFRCFRPHVCVPVWG